MVRAEYPGSQLHPMTNVIQSGERASWRGAHGSRGGKAERSEDCGACRVHSVASGSFAPSPPDPALSLWMTALRRSAHSIADDHKPAYFADSTLRTCLGGQALREIFSETIVPGRRSCKFRQHQHLKPQHFNTPQHEILNSASGYHRIGLHSGIISSVVLHRCSFLRDGICIKVESKFSRRFHGHRNIVVCKSFAPRFRRVQRPGRPGSKYFHAAKKRISISDNFSRRWAGRRIWGLEFTLLKRKVKAYGN